MMVLSETRENSTFELHAVENVCVRKESYVDLSNSLHQIKLFDDLGRLITQSCYTLISRLSSADGRIIFFCQLPIFVDNSATRLEPSPRAHIMPYFSKIIIAAFAQ